MEQEKNIEKKRIEDSLDQARNVLETEARAVLDLKKMVATSFKEAIQMLLSVSGRVVFTGMGKSGHVGRKLAATFSSLGTTAFFVHGAEALHGDLGMITEEDIVIAISHSGETGELLDLLPSLRRIGARMILMTGNCDSTLGQYADICLDSGVTEEACAIGLAPTTSTTAVMALGDALAIALSSLKGFTPEDYAVFHPGGSLGRRLLTRVEDVLKIREQNPTVKENTTMKKALFTMTDSNMGSTSVVNEEGILTGIITDGDIRRQLEKSSDFLSKPVKDFMTKNPTTIGVEELAAEALNIMEEKEINDLPAVKDGRPVGMLNFQDLLRAKVF
ncbi:MAG: KpsF/GutQ family sugar-phosphate isomerase [Bacillota bacterium]